MNFKENREFWPIVQKWLNQETTEQEERLIEQYISSSAENKIFISAIKNIKKIKSMVNIKQEDISSAWDRLETAINKKCEPNLNNGLHLNGISQYRKEKLRNNGLRFAAKLSIAALFVIMLCEFLIYRKQHIISFLQFPETPPVAKVLNSSRGSWSRMMLDDGSSIHLNSGSSLNYFPVLKKGNCSFILEGEAYFELTHKPGRRYTIHAGGITANVLGTKFNIETWPEENEVYVTVVKGEVSVRIDGQPEGDSLVVRKGQMAVYHKQEQEQELKSVNPEKITQWREGILTFDNTPVLRVVKEVERCDNMEFEVADKTMLDQNIKATLFVNNMSEILLNLCLLFNADYSMEGNKVVFRKNRALNIAILEGNDPKRLREFQNPLITFPSERNSLESALNLIERTTGCVFNYNNSIVQLDMKVICPINRAMPLNQFLFHALKNTPNSYYIVDSTRIIISCKKIINGITSRIQGVVYDKESNQPIKDVSVVLEPFGYGGETDETGTYNIWSIPPGKYLLAVRKPNHRTMFQEISINLNVDQKIDFYY